MSDKTKIEWTDATWNPITGCTLVDEGCRHCYAAHLITSWPAIGNHPSRKGLARKNAAGESKFTGEVRLNEQWLDQPLRWCKPRKIFVCAHGDLFHPAVPDEWIDRVFAVMALCPQHTFQVLTKRPARARAYMAANPGIRIRSAMQQIERQAIIEMDWPLLNVWLGTSISDQTSADLRIPDLLSCPAAVRFISAEPMMGPIDLFHVQDGFGLGLTFNALSKKEGIALMGEGIEWVIVGGESGPHARPMHPEWARSLRDQCAAAGVPFLFKQWGEWMPYCQMPDDGDWMYHPLPNPESEDSRRCKFESCCLNIEGAKFGMGQPNQLHRIEDGAFPGPSHMSMFRIGKNRAGRLLDGVTHDGFPIAAPPGTKQGD